MPTYQVDFVDHGESIYRTDHVEHEDDEAAIRHAARRNHWARPAEGSTSGKTTGWSTYTDMQVERGRSAKP